MKYGLMLATSRPAPAVLMQAMAQRKMSQMITKDEDHYWPIHLSKEFDKGQMAASGVPFEFASACGRFFIDDGYMTEMPELVTCRSCRRSLKKASHEV